MFVKIVIDESAVAAYGFKGVATGSDCQFNSLYNNDCNVYYCFSITYHILDNTKKIH